jgi:hypothetical protein
VALAFARRPTAWLSRRCLRGLPVLVLEVSRRVWGLRLRRTEQVLALSRLFMLPSAHYKGVGVRIASFVGSRTGARLRRFSLAVAPRFLWECLNSQTVSWFPAPATSNVACGFPALRSPVCFRSRFIRHLGQEQFSRVPAVSAYSRCIARACGRSTHYSTVSSPCLCAIWTASAVAGSSFLPSL